MYPSHNKQATRNSKEACFEVFEAQNGPKAWRGVSQPAPVPCDFLEPIALHFPLSGLQTDLFGQDTKQIFEAFDMEPTPIQEPQDRKDSKSYAAPRPATAGIGYLGSEAYYGTPHAQLCPAGACAQVTRLATVPTGMVYPPMNAPGAQVARPATVPTEMVYPPINATEGNQVKTIANIEPSSGPPLQQPPRGLSELNLNFWLYSVNENLLKLMEHSQESQSSLQDRDANIGLPRSHSVTMMHSNRSRRQLFEGIILPKWNGKPLIEAPPTN